MPASWKCPECALVNFSAASVCKRCGSLQPESSPAGIVLEDGYVLPPPPPTAGIWRDKATLIMTKDALLPDRCIKCNSPTGVVRLDRKLSWHHPVLYILIFFALLLYAIVAMIVRKQATVSLGLCSEHLKRRRRLLIIGTILLVVGLITPPVAFASNYPGIALLGILLVFVSIVWLVLVARIVTVKKIDERFVWLGGINKEYLAQFPPWQS